jgi:hypothetical protein
VWLARCGGDLSRLSDILRTDEREERFGQAKYGSEWESNRLTADEIRHVELISDAKDVPREQLEQGFWLPLDRDFGANFNVELVPTVRRLRERGGDPLHVYSGAPSGLEAARSALQRALARKDQIERARELLQLLDRYGVNFAPLERLHSGDDRKKLEEARDLHRRIAGAVTGSVAAPVPKVQQGPAIDKSTWNTIATETKCKKWLAEKMRASPEVRPMPKEKYFREAQRQFGGLSRRAFDRAWANAILDTPQAAARWRLPGPTRQSLH